MAKKLFDHLTAITSEQDPKYFEKLSEEDAKSCDQNHKRQTNQRMSTDSDTVIHAH